MIVSKVPLRVSLFGGGTDFPEYFGKHGGGVLTFALDKYMHICLNRTNAHEKIKLMYSDIEFEDAHDLKHNIARNTLTLPLYKEHAKGLEIASFADIPTVGTGLGSSSAYAVGLIEALDKMLGIQATQSRVAAKAVHVELELCKSNIGIQDQFGCALGGIKYLQFHNVYENSCQAYYLPTCNDLPRNLFLIYTGIKRDANEILKEQNSNLEKNIESLDKIRRLGTDACNLLANNSYRAFDDIGPMLHESWELKKSLSSVVSTDSINDLYEYGLAHGPTGGKLLGAGGGGYVLFYVPERNHELFKSIMNPLTDFQAGLDHEGVRSYVVK